MTVRRNIPADTPLLGAIYEAAIPQIETYWPGPVMRRAGMEALINIYGAWVSLSGSTRRGFCVTRDAPIDGVENASEMWIWINAITLGAAAKKNTNREMFGAWWNDLQTRGVALGWGLHVEQYPADTEAMIEDWSARLGIVFEKRPDADGYPWRLVKLSPQEALGKVQSW